MFVTEEVQCGRCVEVEVSEGKRRLPHFELQETVA